ncbi:hypothetical protein PMAYCL1PPCAC_25460, partial [Pristionchus mayeri]
RTYFVVKEPPRVHYKRFFAAVQRRPALWDSSDKDFDNTKITRKLWNQVTGICGEYQGDRVRAEFLRKRKVYGKFLTAGKREHWPYTSQMSFLEQEILHPKKPKQPSNESAESECPEASAAGSMYGDTSDVDIESDFNVMDLSGAVHSTPIHSGNSPSNSPLSSPKQSPKRQRLK